ncbi:MAG: hypothetical protein AAGC44_10925 [Planctomycetota bacterium]
MSRAQGDDPQVEPMGAGHEDAPSMFLRARLAVFARRDLWLGRLYRLLLGVALSAATFILLVSVDAMVVLPGEARLAGLVVFGLFATVVLAWAWRRPVSTEASLRRTGRIVDGHLDDGGPWVLLSMEFGRASAEPDTLRASLRGRTIHRGWQLANAADPRAVYPADRLRLPASRLWLVMTGVLLIGLIFPGLLGTGAVRLLMPMGDTPPYNLTQLAVSWTPDDVGVGQDVSVRARPIGMPADSVQLEVLDPEQRVIDRIMMDQGDDGSFSVVLWSLREPIRFRLVVHDRPTRQYLITPAETLPLQRTESQDSNPTPDQGTQEQEKAPDGSDPGDAAKVRDRLRGLSDRLATLIEQLRQAEPSDPEALRKLEVEIEGLLDDAEALAEQAALASTSTDQSALRQALQGLSEALAAMRLSGLDAPPTDARGDESLRWLERASEAAEQDQRRLAEGAGAFDNAGDSGTSNREGGPADPSAGDPTASGRFDGTTAGGGKGALPQAILQRVPARYRDHIAAYFQELAELGVEPTPRREDSP